MKLSCKVIEDMLPMYYDKVCSEETAALIGEHLKDCPHCNHILSELRSDIAIPEKSVDDMKPLKKIQKRYKKMRMHWWITIVVVLLLIPVVFFVGNEHGEQSERNEYGGHTVDYTKEDAIAYVNEFMTCLVNGDYAKAYTYWDIEEEKHQLLSGSLFEKDEDLANFEADGLKKFCEGGEKLESLGGIESFEFVEISDPSYANRLVTESYFISYSIKFEGKNELFGVNVTQNGITHIRSGNGLIKHPLSHLTLWVQWVVDDYQGRYYDFDLGEWVDYKKEN